MKFSVNAFTLLISLLCFKYTFTQSYSSYIEERFFDHWADYRQLINIGSESSVKSAYELREIKSKSGLDQYSGLSCMTPSAISYEFRTIYQSVRQSNPTISIFKKENSITTNVNAVNEIYSNIYSNIETGILEKDSAEAVKKYFEQFKEKENIKKTDVYKKITELIKSYNNVENLLLSYSVILIYLERIASLNVDLNHTNDILIQLEQFPFKMYLDESIDETTRIFLKNQFLSLIYYYWLEGHKIDERVKILDMGFKGAGELGCGRDSYFDILVACFYIQNKIRTDNPDFKILSKWISENYSKFKSSTNKLFNSLAAYSYTKELDIVTQFILLTLLKNNGIDVLLNSDYPVDGPIEIDLYKKYLISLLPVKPTTLIIETKTNNNCIDKNILNLRLTYEPSTLFKTLRKKEDNSLEFEKKIIFEEKANRVFPISPVTSNKLLYTASDSFDLTMKYIYFDNLLAYIFQRNKNSNASMIRPALEEITGLLQTYNYEKILKNDYLITRYFDYDIQKKKKFILNLVNVTSTNYNQVYIDTNFRQNRTHLSNYLRKIEKNVRAANDSLLNDVSNYLNAQFKDLVLAAPIDQIRNSFKQQFGTLLNELISGKIQSTLTYFGITKYEAPGGYFEGNATLVLRPNSAASVSLNVSINGGTPINNYLNGKILKMQNGAYHFATSDSNFSFNFYVDDCGKKSIELKGTGKNSNIKAIFYVAD